MRDDPGSEPVRTPPTHEIGCDLSAVSVAELRERVAVLAAEISRLRADEARKLSSQEAARAFFKA